MSIAFITGVTGQDGSYLAELLLAKGYEVHSIVRRNSTFNTERIDRLLSDKNFVTHYGDLSDSSNLHRLISSIRPDEVYNLGAQSHVAISFEIPEYTAEVDSIGVIRLLDALLDMGSSARFYQASTSELFGGMPGTEPQSEQTDFAPRSPYAAAKLYAYWVTRNYREAYNMFACNGILFNHESPRRGLNFVTRKITRAVACIKKGIQEELRLGNLNSIRDWGHAKDYVYAQWLMMQQDQPKDYVIATGVGRTVREFVQTAFNAVDTDIKWDGDGINEVGYDSNSGRVLVRVDPNYFRPLEVDVLIGDSRLARSDLGWSPSISFDEMVREMIDNDLKLATKVYE